MIRIGSRRVFTTEIRIVQVVTQLTDGQRREIYLSPIIIGPAIAVLVEPTATALIIHVDCIIIFTDRGSEFKYASMYAASIARHCVRIVRNVGKIQLLHAHKNYAIDERDQTCNTLSRLLYREFP